ncbi:MAG: class I SAM-dependent methyltransferase [Myxococcales bacterium]|nr:class I SAM-dependent methyltransferase [Myxococcales bacterium]
MSTLDTSRISSLLDRLYLEAAVTSADLRGRMASLSPAERQRWLSDGDALYRDLATVHMPVSRAVGRALHVLALTSGARTIVEFGTSFGLSTIPLAAALRDGGGGRLITTELVSSKADAARRHLAEAGLEDLVEIRVGDALRTLAEDLPAIVDLVLLDGHKPLYEPVLELLLPRLRRGASIVADNAAAAPAYLERVRSPGSGFVSVLLADDVEWSVWMDRAQT